MSNTLRPSDTLCVHHPQLQMDGFKSFAVPTFRASTIVFEDAAGYRNRVHRAPDGYTYGLSGTPTTRALEAQLSALQGAKRTIMVPSGQAAISVFMLTVLKAGDHVLIPDNVYPPVKQFASQMLAAWEIEVELYDPMLLDTLAAKIRKGQTKLIWCEAPGSTTMEVCDLPAIARMAREAGALTGCDNTWATGLHCRPLALGFDMVAEAMTKYAGGHSDLLLGAISFADLDLYRRVRNTLSALGVGVSPDDCALTLRGIETMALRLRHSEAVALEFAGKLSKMPGVDAVLHPALPTCSGHKNWKRDFSGGSGVFTVRLSKCTDAVVDKALDSLTTFAIGASWGGTHSLVAPMVLSSDRSLMDVDRMATHLRISIGLEDRDELWNDLERVCRIVADGGC